MPHKTRNERRSNAWFKSYFFLSSSFHSRSPSLSLSVAIFWWAFCSSCCLPLKKEKKVPPTKENCRICIFLVQDTHLADILFVFHTVSTHTYAHFHSDSLCFPSTSTMWFNLSKWNSEKFAFGPKHILVSIYRRRRLFACVSGIAFFFFFKSRGRTYFVYVYICWVCAVCDVWRVFMYVFRNRR